MNAFEKISNEEMMCIDGGFNPGAVSYTHLDVYKRQMCSTAVPQDNYGMKQAIALYIFSTMRRKRK